MRTILIRGCAAHDLCALAQVAILGNETAAFPGLPRLDPSYS